MSYFIGVDIGGTMTKAGLYNEAGEELHIAEKSNIALCSGQGFVERDMSELWTTVSQLIQSCTNKSPEPVRGISFSSHGKGLYAIDKNGNPVRKGIISSDTRAESIVQRWAERGVIERVYSRGRQQLWTAHPVSLLAWLKEHEGQNYENVDSILMVHDYIRYKLTGNIQAEITNISGSNMYNIEKGDYDSTLLDDFGIPECLEKLAPTIDSAELAGTVTVDASKQTGLKPGTQVFGGLFDVVAASVTSCINDDTTLSAVAGTWSISTAVCDSIVESEYPYIWGKYCTPGKYFVHEGSPTSASNLAWFKNQFLQDVNWDTINQWYSSSNQDEDTPYFLPYLFGSNYRLGMHGALIGLEGHHTKKDVIRAVYEGIVFAHLNHQDRLINLVDNIKKIRFTGGPTKSRVWMQLFADASGLPVEVVDIQQSGCRAAALCAAVGYGIYRDFSEAMDATSPSIINIEPNLQRNDVLRSKFSTFNKVNHCLTELPSQERITLC
ncbi:carbohydrate kinase [Vibrio sp.]|nr:carbohydrate kinase [Vibrio sp.]